MGKGQANPGMPVGLKVVEERCPGLDWRRPGFSTGTKFYAALKGPAVSRAVGVTEAMGFGR